MIDNKWISLIMGIATLKAILGRYKRGALMLVIIALVLALGLSAYYKQMSAPDIEPCIQSKEPVEVSDSVSFNDELSERIKQLVKGLQYPDEVAEDFNRMVMAWKDEQRCPFLVRWKEKLINAHQIYQQSKISRRKVAKIEESVLREISETIEKQFNNKNLAFELSDVIQNRQTNCLGYTQLMYIIANAVGLSVKPIDVLEPARSVKDDAKKGHIACIIDLFDGRSVMADMSLLYETPSRAFELEDHFVKVVNYWELRYTFNRLLIHRKFQILDRKELIAVICHHRGYIYKSKGEYDRAIVEYNKAIEINPGFTKAYNGRGNAYQGKGEYDRAILDYTKAIEIDPKDAMAYTNRGNAFDAKGEYDHAIADHTKAIEIDPKYFLTYSNRGIVYADKGEFDRAIKDYTKAIEIDPNYANAYNNRGACYYQEKEYDLALQDFTKAIEINPKYINAYFNRGGVFCEREEYDRAILDFSRAIEINPGDALAYAIRGSIYIHKNEFDRAIEDCIKAIELDPNFTGAYNNRGNAFSEKEEYNQAILDYKKAIEIDPDYALAYLNRAEVYAKLGKSEEVKKDLLKALELDPELRESVKELSEEYELDLKLD